MTVRKTTKIVNKARIFRAVASSCAIETGESIKTIEAKLKSQDSKFKHLTLAQ